MLSSLPRLTMVLGLLATLASSTCEPLLHSPSRSKWVAVGVGSAVAAASVVAACASDENCLAGRPAGAEASEIDGSASVAEDACPGGA